MPEWIGQIAGSGVLGAILCVLGYAYWIQSRELLKAQEARVADAKKVAETMLGMQDRWQSTIGELVDAIQSIPKDPPPPNAKPRRLP